LDKGEFAVIIGMSGSGKTTAIKILEDLDFFWVDNLPPSLIPKFAQLCCSSGFKQVAVAADDSGDKFVEDLQEALQTLSSYGFRSRIVFLDAPDDILVRRFSEHYRRHPMAQSGRIMDGIRKERVRLSELKGKADRIINTGDLTRAQLREEITRFFFHSENGVSPIIVTILSFGYKYGIPIDVDLVFDTRVLPNPFYDPKLQNKDGTEEEVREFLFGEKVGEELLEHLYRFLKFMIVHYIKRGKPHLTIGIGCTGGRHRSVAVAAKLSEFLKANNYTSYLNHRDINKH